MSNWAPIQVVAIYRCRSQAGGSGAAWARCHPQSFTGDGSEAKAWGREDGGL